MNAFQQRRFRRFLFAALSSGLSIALLAGCNVVAPRSELTAVQLQNRALAEQNRAAR